MTQQTRKRKHTANKKYRKQNRNLRTRTKDLDQVHDELMLGSAPAQDTELPGRETILESGMFEDLCVEPDIVCALSKSEFLRLAGDIATAKHETFHGPAKTQRRDASRTTTQKKGRVLEPTVSLAPTSCSQEGGYCINTAEASDGSPGKTTEACQLHSLEQTNDSCSPPVSSCGDAPRLPKTTCSSSRDAAQSSSSSEASATTVASIDEIFQRDGILGEGTYGVVYRATRRDTGTTVALKKLRWDSQSDGIPATSVREVVLLRDLVHPNVVRLKAVHYETGRTSKSLPRMFLEFEYLELDLRKYMKTFPHRRIPLDTVKSIMFQILRALAYCHGRRVIHRDIKPNNILLRVIPTQSAHPQPSNTKKRPATTTIPRPYSQRRRCNADVEPQDKPTKDSVSLSSHDPSCSEPLVCGNSRSPTSPSSSTQQVISSAEKLCPQESHPAPRYPTLLKRKKTATFLNSKKQCSHQQSRDLHGDNDALAPLELQEVRKTCDTELGVINAAESKHTVNDIQSSSSLPLALSNCLPSNELTSHNTKNDQPPTALLPNLKTPAPTVEIKLADFGLARIVPYPLRPLTREVVTLWYRAPEILMGCPEYTPAIDIWAVGCVFAELLYGRAVFPGDVEIDTLFKIFQLLGTPDEQLWEGVSKLPHYKTAWPKWKRRPDRYDYLREDLDEDAKDLLDKLLMYDHRYRITAAEALNHPWFQTLQTHPLSDALCGAGI